MLAWVRSCLSAAARGARGASGSAAGAGSGRQLRPKRRLPSVEERGGKPYPIPAGASDHELGGHGFAGWAFELEDQEKELGFAFDNVIVCSVTQMAR